MTIQRQYSLPNCQLLVEGLAEDSGSLTARPVLSRVINVECRFLGQSTPLKGGRDFLESLTREVNSYAQEFLSGIPHPHRGRQGLVQIQRMGHNLHRIIVQPEHDSGNGAQAIAPAQIDLKTIQLFDLVEAIDQFYADAQTLPELQLNLSPLPKRYVVNTEPMAKRAVPAAVGISGLAVAAIALFFMPVPQRRPVEPTAESTPPTTTSTPTGTASPAASPPPTPAAETTPIATPEVAPSPADSPSPVDSSSPVASPSPADSPGPVSTSSSPEQLGSILNTNAPEINDPDTLRQLGQQLRGTLADTWQTRPTFVEDLVYRVSVVRSGDITGFRYVNDASREYVKETPLGDLSFNPVEGAPPEAIAEFRVVFTPDRVVEVSPWHGIPSQ